MYLSKMGEYKRGPHVYKMSHMIADTDEELHAMAARIGVQRKWFQKAGTSTRHYDITMTMRAKAVAAGAVEITMKQAALMCRHRRLTGGLCKPEEAKSNEKSD
jgi:hypothetical protein